MFVSVVFGGCSWREGEGGGRAGERQREREGGGASGKGRKRRATDGDGGGAPSILPRARPASLLLPPESGTMEDVLPLSPRSPTPLSRERANRTLNTDPR